MKLIGRREKNISQHSIVVPLKYSKTRKDVSTDFNTKLTKSDI